MVADATTLRAMLSCVALAAALACQQHVDETPFPIAASKKGLQVQMVDDAIALGIHHATVNVSLGQLLESPPRTDAGELRLRRAGLEALDAQVRPLTEAGVIVSAILLAIRTGDPARDALLCHPDGGPAAPNGITAFRTSDAEGRALLADLIGALAKRYTADARGRTPNGRIWNWIVGNEVNSHWWWYHMGRCDMQDVVASYERAVRLVHDAVRRHSAHGRVYVSLEHHWTQRYAAGDEQQAFGARPFLEAFATRTRETGGDYGWHVAFHPYPENLFECRFWNDATAPDDDDAHRVTFKNLPVLMRFLARDALRFDGSPRRVILSEQGFHCADREHGERDQAAAFALAWSIVGRLDGIDAFVLHRHVDHAREGGLRLGLWTHRPDTVCTPERRRRIAEVFAACDTDAWPECAAFALPVIGIDSFDTWSVR